MGVYRRDYIVYGWKLPYDLKDSNGDKINIWDDKFLPMIEGHKNEEFTLITDSMCGGYNVFGLLLNSSDEWDFVQLDFSGLDPEKVKSKYKELFGLSDIEEPKLFIFSNFS
jgi:hypothetical protein